MKYRYKYAHTTGNSPGGEKSAMNPVTDPTNMAEALAMVHSGMGFLAEMGTANMPAGALAEFLHAMEHTDAVGAAARGKAMAAFDAQDGPVADGQRTMRAWMVNTVRVTRGQAAEHIAVQRLAETHEALLAGLANGALTRSIALQLANWTAAIPDEYRDQAEQILVAAARAGADLRALAAICAEIRARTAGPDPDGPDDSRLDRGVYLDTTIDGAGVMRADLTPECTAMVQAVLDALSAPEGGGDLRTQPQRYHDALEEAMRRLLSSDLLPKRAGQPTKALVHISFADLCEMDTDSALQDKWIEDYRAQWAAQRAAASVSTGDGGAWLEGDAARAIARDAMIIPVVTADIDPGAIETLIAACVEYHRIRAQAATQHDAAARQQDTADRQDSADQPDDDAAAAGQAGSAAEVLAMLEHQILAQVIQVVSGPGGLASFLRRNLLGKGLNGPSLPLDVGQTDDIPVHLRRLVALRDQTCRFPGGCDQPACRCEPHHIRHRKDGGHTSLTELQDWCHWHHHVVLHQMGWQLTVHPDGTGQVASPVGKTIRSHSPPPRPG
jgi:Domain of unknown function (DUF222)